MNPFLEQTFENPGKVAIALVSTAAIVTGLGLGFHRGAFNPDPLQQQLEAKQQNHALQKQSIALANDRYDAGCEGVFYLKRGLKPNTSSYQPLTEGTAVLSGDYWQRWEFAKGRLTPALTDHLPAGTIVCDAYGNVGILATLTKGKPAVITDLLNTPDRNRINTMMKRYPSATRPQVGS
jgi:hypothetical protein